MPSRIAELQLRLDELREQYANDPTNHALERATAFAFQRWHYEATREKAEQEKHERREAQAAWTAAQRAYKALTWPEFLELLPDTCPGCGGPVRQYFSRVADRGWRHQYDSKCRFEGEV